MPIPIQIKVDGAGAEAIANEIAGLMQYAHRMGYRVDLGTIHHTPLAMGYTSQLLSVLPNRASLKAAEDAAALPIWKGCLP